MECPHWAAWIWVLKPLRCRKSHFMKTGVQKLSLGVLLVLGLIELGRGGFHWLAPDAGAGVVAGVIVSYPRRAIPPITATW
jgi:hypothetical protein